VKSEKSRGGGIKEKYADCLVFFNSFLHFLGKQTEDTKRELVYQ